MTHRITSHAGRVVATIVLAATSCLVLPAAAATAAPTATAKAADSTCARRTATDPTGQTLIGRWSSTKTSAFGTNQRWCAYDEYSDRRIVWQADGNLVIYTGSHSGGRAVGSSHTATIGTALRFQSDGNVAVYDAANRPRWALQTLGKDVDGRYWSPSSNIREYRFSLVQVGLSGIPRTDLIAYEVLPAAGGYTRYLWRY